MVWVKNNYTDMSYVLEPFLSKCFDYVNVNGIYLFESEREPIFKDGILPRIESFQIYKEDSGEIDVRLKFIIRRIVAERNVRINGINMTEQKQNTTLYDYKQIDNYYYKIPKNNLVCFNNVKDKDKFIKIWLWFQGLHDTRTIIIQNILTLLRLDYDGYEKIEI
jgi:hypothetical protein